MHVFGGPHMHGRGLSSGAEYLLLDEPTTDLDLKYQIEMLELLRGLRVERHLAGIMVLHDINLAGRFASHIVAVREGGVVLQGGAW